MERIRIGSGDIAISWAVYDIDGLVHDFSDKELELYMACGGYKVPVTGYTIQDNVLSWVFKQEKQTKTGDYKLILVERVPDNGGSVVCVERAFRLTPEDLIACDIIVAPYDIAVRSIITYSSLVGVASVDVVESDDDEGNNIVSIILNNGHTVQFTVKNGSKGDQGNSGYQGAAGELEVVNNLTDGGETAALSAEMGKRLKGLHDDNVGRIGALERISERVYDDEGYVASDSESYPATIAAGGGAIEYEDGDQNKKIAVIPDSLAESQIAGEDGVDYETLVSETRIAALRGKVDGIAEGAQVNVIESIRIPGAESDVPVSGKKATLPVDSVPTGGSKNLVLSGVIAEALAKKAAVAAYNLGGSTGVEFSPINGGFLLEISSNANTGIFLVSCSNDDYMNTGVVSMNRVSLGDLAIEFYLDPENEKLIVWTVDGATVRILGIRNESPEVTEIDEIPSASFAEQVEVEYFAVVADLVNFITRSVDDLVNYYTKSQTYTKAEVKSLVEAIKQFTYQVVATLPTASADTMNIIFLVPSSNPETQNVKDEFITIRSGSEGSYTYSWEQIGSTEIDLSGYPTTEQMNAAISAAVSAALESVALTFATKTEVNQLGQELYAISSESFNKYNAYLQLHHETGEDVYSSTGSKYSWIFPVKSGAEIKAKGTYGKGIFIAVYSSLSGALKGFQQERLQLISGYTTGDISGIVNVDGFLRVGASAVDGQYIDDVAPVIAATNIELAGENSLQRASSFPVIATNGIFNANNETRKFEIPKFRIWVNGQSHLVNEQVVDYNFTDILTWKFLVLSDDFSSVEIVHYADVNKLNRDRVIAFFTTIDTSTYYIPQCYIVSYFEGSQSCIWTVDGKKPDAAIKAIDERVGSVRTIFDSDYLWRRKTVEPFEIIDDPNGTRLRVIYKVKKGDHLFVKTNWVTGLFADVFPNLYLAARSSGETASQVILTRYTLEPVDVDIIKDGYLTISFKPQTDVAITDAMLEEMLNATTLLLSSGNAGMVQKATIGVERIQMQSYPLPDFVIGTASVSGNAKVEASTYGNARVVIKDCVALPYNGCRLYVKLPAGFVMGFRFFNGYNNTDAASGGVWLKPGESIQPAYKYSHFMCYLAYTINGKDADNTYSFDVDEINHLVENGDIAVTYEDNYGGVKQRVFEGIKQLKATMVRYTSNRAYNIQGVMPTFVHTSDIHGDAVRWRNAALLAKHISADGLIYTGDSCAYHVENGFSFLSQAIKDITPTVPVIATIGNHDANGDSTYLASLNTNLYNNIIKPFEVSGGYTLPTSAQYHEAPTYYYRDFADKNIRVIVLNLYDYGLINWAYNVFSQKQIDWLISTLASTPANYGVMIAYHRSQYGVSKDNNYPKFWQLSSTAGYEPNTWRLSGVSGKPIVDIIDAFIAKSHLESSFTQTVIGGTTETINIDADFTSLNTGVEFIAHVFGHHHRDTVGYYDSVQKQLTLCVCQGTAAYSSQYTAWAGPSDLPRNGGGKEQDAFNVYTIDRAAKTVRIAKFGSTLNSETLQPRDYMVIPYAD